MIVTPSERATAGNLVNVWAASSGAATALRAGALLFIVALTALAARVSVPLPFTPVPFTLQPLVVLLGGAVLGARLGLASQVLYLAAGVAGLPVFAWSPLLPNGAARLLGPTGGYLMSYPLAAWVTGALAERGFDRRYATSVVAMAAGLAVIFAGGVTWLALVSPGARTLAEAARAGLWPFLAADVLKVLAGAALLPQLWRLLGQRRPSAHAALAQSTSRSRDHRPKTSRN
jgi:biotin transport system substrate-specific component